MSTKYSLSDDDKAAFRAAMEGTTPWDDARESPMSQAAAPPLNQWINLTHLPEEKWVGPESIIEFSRDGVSLKQRQQLASGQIKTDQIIDLHGHTLNDLYENLYPQIHQARQAGRRLLLIITGKGCTNSQRPALLKNYLNQSLRQNPNVLAFRSAKPPDGGTGAIYVLLKQRGKHV